MTQEEKQKVYQLRQMFDKDDVKPANHEEQKPPGAAAAAAAAPPAKRPRKPAADPAAPKKPRKASGEIDTTVDDLVKGICD